MARPLWIGYAGAYFHLISHGNDRAVVFERDFDRAKFIKYLESSTPRHDGVIHAFCRKDSIYHLLIDTPSGNYPQIVRHINGTYLTLPCCCVPG